MGFADLHLHSIYSRDGTCSIEAILYKAQQRRLDVIAITDHNSMKGVIEALTLVKRYRVQVIPGIEISTANGHLLAYEVSKPVHHGLSLKESALRVYEQGGFCTIPHPMSLGADAIQKHALLDALQVPAVAETILAIEEINGGLFRRNNQSVGLAQQYGLAPVGNSDGHNIDAIGRVVTQFEGTTIHDLKTAFRQQTTSARWHYRIFDPIYYAKHTTYRILRNFGYGFGLNEKPHSPQLDKVANLKK